VQHQVHATLGVGLDAGLYEEFAKQLLFGLARLQARTLATDVVPLVVSHGRRDRALAELMELWESQGVHVPTENLIDLAPMTAGRPQMRGSTGTETARSAAPTRVVFRVMAILFADVEDYSKIPEDRLPVFIEHFVGGVATQLRDKPYRAANIRRVGDGLLMIFASVRDAAACALDLVDWAADGSRAGADGATHWSRVGLPREMRIRVALHAGPIFECEDPLTHTVAFEGAHVNYAARIEPVTPGNQVYASEAFAALAASWPEQCDEFVCEYVGRTPLAKNFGDYPLYHLRRS
jgi:class 3 adenylate cyclase